MTEEFINDYTITIAKLLRERFDDIENHSLGKVKSGVSVGFDYLDDMTQGLPKGSLIVLGGRPSMGKTTFSLNMALNVAKSQNLPICIFNLERSKEQICDRFLSMECKIDTNRIRTGKLTKDEWQSFADGINTIGTLPIFIANKHINSILDMQRICQSIKEQSLEQNLGLIILDYQRFHDYSPFMDVSKREENLSNLIKGLKSIAKGLNVPIILISQVDKDVEKRSNKRPLLSDLRDCDVLEFYTDIIWMIYRDVYYNLDTEDERIAEIITYKNNNGPPGTVKLLFEPEYGIFRNLDY